MSKLSVFTFVPLLVGSVTLDSSLACNQLMSVFIDSFLHRFVLFSVCFLCQLELRFKIIQQLWAIV